MCDTAQHIALPHLWIFGGRESVQEPCIHSLALLSFEVDQGVTHVAVKDAEMHSSSMQNTTMPAAQQGWRRLRKRLGGGGVPVQARNPLPTGFAERVALHANKMQYLVGLAQQGIGTDAKVESATEAKFGDSKPRDCSLPGSGDEIRRLNKHALHFRGTIIAEIDVVELCRVRLAFLPANACWRDVLVMFAHSKRRAGSMIGLDDGPVAIGNPSAPGVGV